MRIHIFLSLITIVFVSVLVGCSSSSNPISNDSALPGIISESEDVISGTGILGSYTMSLDPVTMEFEMTPSRQSAIGESNMIEGIKFFTMYPCGNCFYIKGVKGDANGIILDFRVTHPMPAGNPANPPSGKNRLDLDVFDLAIVLYPYITPTNFPLLNQDIMSDFTTNQSGYTTELSSLDTNLQNLALPYFLVIDDTIAGFSTFNKFEMGQYQEVWVRIKPQTMMIFFDLYLTMGYGASATYWQRLTPKYYNPEFNRKSAWKVTATPENFWPDDTFAPENVIVQVYDWQQGATVCANPDDFANAPTNQVYSASNVQEVQVEILGMAPWPTSITTPDSGTGSPGDPLIYTVPVGNYNYLPNGTYLGIVKVIDSRTPDTNLAHNRDCIISTEDGKVLTKYVIPEYATYQTFTAIVG